MFKLVVLSALLALASARPSLLHAPLVTAHSAIVGSVPTSISHSTSSVVHSAAIASPILAAAPVVHAAPVVIAAPTLVRTASIVGTVPTSVSHSSSSVVHSAAYAAPAVLAHSAPIVAHGPVVSAYASGHGLGLGGLGNHGGHLW